MNYPARIKSDTGDVRIVNNEFEHSYYPGYEPQLLDEIGQPWRDDVHEFPPKLTKAGAWTRKRGRK